MAITERQRRAVFDKLEEILGEEPADTLMQMLPRVSGDELATRSDVHATASMLRGEMAELRGEIAELRADVRTEIAGLQRWMAAIVAANAIAVITALVA